MTRQAILPESVRPLKGPEIGPKAQGIEQGVVEMIEVDGIAKVGADLEVWVKGQTIGGMTETEVSRGGPNLIGGEQGCTVSTVT